MKGEKKSIQGLGENRNSLLPKAETWGPPSLPQSDGQDRPAAAHSWVSCLQWALAPDPCTAKPQQEGAGRASPAQDRVRGWGLGRQRGPRAHVGWRKMGCGGEATCTHVPVVETSVNHQYCTSYREGLGTAPRATAGGRWGGPVFTTATSDGPLVHWASYLPRGLAGASSFWGGWRGADAVFPAALGRLSSSGAVTVAVPLPGLATQALSSLKVNVISPCARTLPDGGAAPRHSLGTAHGCHGCLLASSSKASVAWVSGAHSTPGTHSEVPFPRHPLAASPPLALPFGQRHSCEVVGVVVGVSDVDF